MRVAEILIVDDQPDQIRFAGEILKSAGYRVYVATSGKRALSFLETRKPDLIVLDIKMEDIDGITVCGKIKNNPDTKEIPVIFLTAQDEETSVVLGLDLGADDYIVKPFRTRELISRINSVLRRYGHNESNLIQYKNIKIDTSSAKVYKDNEEIIFTSLEYKILLMLFSNQNKLISREQLLEKIWDIAGNFVNDNTLTVYIKRIREKLGDETIIKTVRGLGYRIGE